MRKRSYPWTTYTLVSSLALTVVAYVVVLYPIFPLTPPLRRRLALGAVVLYAAGHVALAIHTCTSLVQEPGATPQQGQEFATDVEGRVHASAPHARRLGPQESRAQPRRLTVHAPLEASVA